MLGDVEAQAFLKAVKYGWPNDRCQLPSVVQPYFPIRDTLSHQNDIILKGERISIPKALRPDMKRQLHSAHLGLASMMRRAPDTIFWLGMRHDIQQLADNSHICQATKPGNQREPLYCKGFLGVRTYVEVWGVAQRSSCLRGMTVVACRDAGFPKHYQRGSLVVVRVLF